MYPTQEVMGKIYESVEEGVAYPWPAMEFHLTPQNTGLPAWDSLLQLIEDAMRDGRELFKPREALGTDAWQQITRLPATMGALKAVKKLDLYGSSLLSIPPEVGEMDSLVEFVPYTSYGLHWFPYEITRCKKLRSSTVSTRALYGNYKSRPPFPDLSKTVEDLVPATCSVCQGRLTMPEVHQVWISLRVASDVLPLLVNACSLQCIHNLPSSAPGYVQQPHKGGLGLVQPPAEW